ncbi:MAG: sulfotransferase family protein [Hyphomicrobium sp.]
MIPNCHPLVISGAPRSGTSLLYNLFDQHPDVAWLVDEGFLFEYLTDLGGEGVEILLDAVPADIDQIVAGIRDKQVMPPVHLPYEQSKARGSVSEVTIAADWDEEAFRAALAKPRGRSPAGLWHWLASALIAGMHRPAVRFACMKSPDFGKSIVSALATIPEARAIVIVRDPLYSIDSLKRSREMRSAKLLTWPLIAQSIRSFQQLHDRISAADPTRFRAVRYETLVDDPEPVMRSLADWLEIPFVPSLIQPTMRGEHWPGISSFEATDGIERKAKLRPIQALTNEEQALVRKHLSALRAVFDYE